MSRRAIRNMNTLYPDATEADLASGNIIFLHKTSIGFLKYSKNFHLEQVCIPVGCALPLRWPPLGVSVQRGSLGGRLPERRPPVNRMTDMGKNITFPQLRLRAVIMLTKKSGDSVL